MPRTRKAAKPPQTTAQQLSALIKSVRQILRKDKGLNGDADRLPLLTWVMFLKFLDDLELEHEREAGMDSRAYEPLIEAPYRWRDWAGGWGEGGDDLLAFINQDKARGPDGKRRQGLFAYLRSLADRETNGGQRRVISN